MAFLALIFSGTQEYVTATPFPDVPAKMTVPTFHTTKPSRSPSTTRSTTRSRTSTTPTTTASTTTPKAPTHTLATQGGSPWSSMAPPIPTVKETTATVPTLTTKTESAKSSTTPSTKGSTNSSMATTYKSLATKGRPMNPKTILCTFGLEILEDTVGPEDGVCDIIIFDFLYLKGRGTFLNHTAWPLRWFLNYVGNHTGRITEFGIGIYDREVREATHALYSRRAQKAVQDFWRNKLRHYAVLKVPVDDALLKTRIHAQNYINLFKKLREVQEITRADKFEEPGYLILGIGLYAPRSGEAHKHLKYILQTAPLDGVVIRTHLEDPPQALGDCKITGPNVYTNSFNTYEVSMMEALDYVQTNYDMFRRHKLMVSFSMSVLLTLPSVNTTDHGYQFGSNCETIQFFHVLYAICFTGNVNNLGRLVRKQHVMHRIDKVNGVAITYDSPDTINWKICTSAKQYHNLTLGVALFSLGYEDGGRSCNQYGVESFNALAGYWRAQEVSIYMKNVRDDPDFLTNNPEC